MIRARQVTRRTTLTLGAAGLASSLARRAAGRESPEWHSPERHGISAFDDLKYPPDFAHFDYVDPNAPKGGVFSHVGSTRAFNQNFLTFNSLNTFILKGDARAGHGTDLRDLDESAPKTSRTRSMALPRVPCGSLRMGSRIVSSLRPGIKFHDGSAITAYDVVFSLEVLKEKGHPIAQQLLRDFVGRRPG